jgi:MYXO-CTERM domain-containing protein
VRTRLFATVPALLAGLATALTPTLAHAVRHPDALGSRPTVEHHDGGSGVVRGAPRWDSPPQALRRELSLLRAELGAGWRASFDEATGVPSRLYGPGLEAPGSVANGDMAVAVAKGVLSRHVALLAPGCSASDFELVSNDLDAGMRTLGFVQKSGDLRVLGGQISFRFKNDRLFMIGSEALPSAPGLTLPSGVDLAAVEKQATAWVASDFGLSAADPAGEPVVLPHRDASGALSFAVAIPVDVTPLTVTAKFRVYVDATTLRPIVREQLYKFAGAGVSLRVPERSPTFGERFDAPAPLTNFSIAGVAGQTDAAGVVAWEGVDPVTVDLLLQGPRARVWNDGGPEALLSTTLTDALPHVFDFSADVELDAEVTTYTHAGRVREYARTFAPVLGFLNQQVQATVNIDEYCNAFSDGTSINFYISGQGCQNTGRIADVIYHEYGHSLHNHAIIEGVGAFDGALSEGQADYLAATITGDPGTARGFFFDDEPLRDIDPANGENLWPDDLIGEVHHDGLIIGQTLWDLRQNLVDKLGDAEGVLKANELYYQALRRAVDIPSMYPEVLAADDDDGDITNGTPNVCEINEAFGRHGLRPVSAISSGLGVLPPAQDGYDVSVELIGLFEACEGEAILGGTLSWRDRDNPSSSGDVELDLSGNVLSGTIPSQPEDSVIKYSVAVQLDGRTVTMPDNEADPEYELFVGSVTPLYCTDFESDPMADGWTHELLDGTDEEGADDWMWGEANGTAANGDPTEAFSGDKVFGNDLALENNYNGLYKPDVTNVARTPVIDLKGHKKVHLQYRRWLNVEDAFFDQASISANDMQVWQNLNSNDGTSSNTQHRDKEWRFQDVDLSGIAQSSDTMQVSFRIQSDQGLQFGGWTIDDVCIVALDEAAPPPCGEGGGGEGGCGQGGGGGEGGGEGGEGGVSINPTKDDGCDCTVQPQRRGGPGWLALGLMGVGLALRRRRR